MSNQAIASYLPDFQLIKLGTDLPAFCCPEDIRGFIGPHEISYFFHEWLHYLHNVSTVHGLSAFANLVHLWSMFRTTIGSDGLSLGSSQLSDEYKIHLKQKIAFSSTARKSNENKLPPGISIDNVKIVKVDFEDTLLPASTVLARTILCEIQVHNSANDFYSASVRIGPHEIVESVAYMLESRLVRALGEKPRKIDFAPYFLLEAVSKYIAPSLSEDCIIACGLASLQGSFPSTDLHEILTRAESVQSCNSDVFNFLKNKQSCILSQAQEWIDERISEINAIFPFDEVMAKAVRKVTETISNNFEKRRIEPFFEFSLLQKIASNVKSLDSILQEYGACGVLQRCPGFEDDVERDRIFEFVIDSKDNSELNEGRRLMHAAFRFVGQHSFLGDFLLATTEIPENRSNMCPFYSVCPDDNRKLHPEICAEKPWQWAAPSTPKLCWYAQGVRKASPPHIAYSIA